MRAFAEVVRLELRRLVRSRAVLMLLAASVAWMLAMPHLVKSDGTAEGARQLYIHFSLGGVFALCCVCLAASAASTLARDREGRRLQLTKVRPVARMTVALGRMAALTLVGAAVLAVCAGLLACRTGLARPCSHVLSPVMESVEAEAERMYAYYLADPDSPPEVRTARKATVMRILRQGALDHYQSIATNETAEWTFDLGARRADAATLAVRLRFTNDFDLREDVRGAFAFGDWSGTISNITQAIVTVPLERGEEGRMKGEGRRVKGEVREIVEDSPTALRPSPFALRSSLLTFHNAGKASLMLRPRKDIQLLVGADAFGWNLLRAYGQLVAILAALVAFAVFLGAGLGRSVAVFTCMAFLFVAVVSDDVIGQYPDQFETDRIDRIGLAITRAVEFVARPVGSLRPLAALSADECVERGETALVLLVDALLIPFLFAFASGLLISLREDND